MKKLNALFALVLLLCVFGYASAQVPVFPSLRLPTQTGNTSDCSEEIIESDTSALTLDEKVWAVGLDHLLNKKGVAPSPSWASLPYNITPDNLARMVRGRAPLDKFEGRRVELHHVGQLADGVLQELYWRDHRGQGAFGANHVNTGQSLTLINRSAFRRQREEHWKKRAAEFIAWYQRGIPR